MSATLALEELAHERRRAEHAARDAKREARGVSLQLLDVVGRDVVERDRVDEHEPVDALGPIEREVHRHRAAEVDADDRRLGEPERGERAVEIVRLRGDAVLGVERPIGFAVAEEVDRERGAARRGQRGSDVAPEETAGAESVYEQDRRAAVAVALDVHRAGSDGNSKEISVHDVRASVGESSRGVSRCALVLAQPRYHDSIFRYRARPTPSQSFRPPRISMSEQEQTYDDGRARNLEALLRALAERIGELDAHGKLLDEAGELMRLIGDVRSELFHYEVRVTYDTPEVAENRRIVREAQQDNPAKWQKSEWNPDEDESPES